MTLTEQAEILSGIISGRAMASSQPPGLALEALFAAHRVTGRALAYIQRYWPAWADDDALMDRLASQQHVNRGVIAQHASALRMLRDDWMTPGEPVVIIKGLAIYAHTGSPSTIRPTLDLDILVTDPQRLVRGMKAAALHEYRKVSPHELINVALADVPVDLHAHYPVWSVDRHLGRPILSSHGGTLVHEHVSKLVVNQIPVDALLADAIPASIFDLPDIWYPGVSMCALISCVHCFRDYLSRSSVTARSKPPLKFAEIAEFADYVTLPAFDIDHFCDLAEHYSAYDAVEWLIDKVETYHGAPAVVDVTRGIRARINRPADMYLMPAQAVWMGFWCSLKRDPADALLRHPQTAEVVSRLSPIFVPIVNDRADMAIMRDGTAIGARHTGVVHARAEGCLPLRVTAYIGAASLALDVELERTNPEHQVRLHLDINNEAFEFHWRDEHSDWKKSKSFPEPHVETSSADGMLRVRVVIDVVWDVTSAKAARLPIVLAAGEFRQNFDISKGTLLPLVLVRQQDAELCEGSRP